MAETAGAAGATGAAAAADGASGHARRWPLLRVEVAENSMLPELCPGDWLIARRTRRIRPGQVVLAWHPARAGLLLVKRAARRTDGGWWLESDNPAAPGASDSSRFGPVPEGNIVGWVVARYYPFGVIRIFKPSKPSKPNGPASCEQGTGPFGNEGKKG
jgi:nickel-type superoxide dismutase maturation protease